MPFPELLGPDGLGYETIASACGCLAPPVRVTDLESLGTCLRALVVEDAAHFVALRQPRAREALACMALDTEFPGAFREEPATCANCTAASPLPSASASATPDPTIAATVTPFATVSPTAVATATITAAPTIAATPTATAVAVTPTRTGTPVPTATSTRTATPAATPTRTTTPAITATPVPTATRTARPAVCGDGNIDPPETCDDGNTVNGDACPANCIIQSCTPTTTTRAVDVGFAGSANVAGLTVYLEYPEGKVGIPGTGSDSTVQDRISNTPTNALPQANDLDYALTMGVVKTTAIPVGRLFTVQFDTCSGAASPTASEFPCVVTDASDRFGGTVTGVTCTATLP